MSKQVIVLRKDLNMRKGKLVAQGSHGVMGVLLELMLGTELSNFDPCIENGEYNLTLNVKENSELDKWLRGNYKKICTYVNSEEELLGLHMKAKESNLPVFLVNDSGLTEFHGVATTTGLVIGPEEDELIDKVTGHLPLL